MKRVAFELFLIAVLLPRFGPLGIGQTGQDRQMPNAIVDHLHLPVYPPLARQARIAGDVVLEIWVRRDGTVASAKVISGHPMLVRAAVDSATRSTFVCQDCKEDTALYLLSYTFGLRIDPDASCIDGGSYVRARKCLYLWKCAWRDAPPSTGGVGEAPGRVMVLAQPACVEP
jgi:TonB family protein